MLHDHSYIKQKAMTKHDQAKAKLIDTIGHYNCTASNISKFKFSEKETNLFANMMIEHSKDYSLDFIDWLMTNCELSEDQSIWSYMGEDYSLEGIHELFAINRAVHKYYEH
jgi:hypothetical protein